MKNKNFASRRFKRTWSRRDWVPGVTTREINGKIVNKVNRINYYDNDDMMGEEKSIPCDYSLKKKLGLISYKRKAFLKKLFIGYNKESN